MSIIKHTIQMLQIVSNSLVHEYDAIYNRASWETHLDAEGNSVTADLFLLELSILVYPYNKRKMNNTGIPDLTDVFS